MNNEGIHMDESVKTELEQIESRLKLAMMEAIHESIRTGIKELKEEIKELLGKDIQHINEHLTRHDKYHEEHYNAARKIWKAIDDIRVQIPEEIETKTNPLSIKVNEIEDHQIQCSASRETEISIEDRAGRKTEITWGKVAAIASVVAVLFTAIGYLINMGT